MLNFQQLAIWQKAHALTLEVYALTAQFPKDELFGLTSQMRRSASYVPTNIAEGCGRNTKPDLKRFLTISIGPVSELEYQFILSKDLQYCTDDQFLIFSSKVIELRRMIYTYHSKFYISFLISQFSQLHYFFKISSCILP